MDDRDASPDGPDHSGARGDLPDLDGPDLDGFVAELISRQSHLRAYILASIGDHNDAFDILQRTNLVLWKSVENFRPGSDFLPWAMTIARYEILSYYRDRGRDRHVFTEEVATLMIQAVQDRTPDPTARQLALRRCVSELPVKSRDLIRRRYELGQSIQEIADSLRRTENAIKCSFLRVRKSLQQCVSRRLGVEE